MKIYLKSIVFVLCVYPLFSQPITVQVPTQADACMWTSFGNNGINGTVYATAVSGANVYVVGDFVTANGITVNHIAKWDGVSWSALGTGADDLVTSVAVAGTKVYIGGRFIHAGGKTVNHVAVWDGTMWSSMGGGTDNWVNCIAVSSDTVVIGGSFSSAGGKKMYNIARWNGLNWNICGSGLDNEVQSVVINGGNIYAGGKFYRSLADTMFSPGTVLNSVGRFDGTQWKAMGSGMHDGLDNSFVNSLDAKNGFIYAGGNFRSSGGKRTMGVAKWDGSAWSSIGWGVNVGTITSIRASGNNIYVGGLFTSVDSPAVKAVNNLAKWDGIQWSSVAGGIQGELGAHVPMVSGLTVDYFTKTVIVSGWFNRTLSSVNQVNPPLNNKMIAQFSDTDNDFSDPPPPPPPPILPAGAIIQFNLQDLIYSPPSGPLMFPLPNTYAYTGYQWKDSVTKSNGISTNLAGITASDLSFRLNEGKLLSFALMDYPNGRKGDERIYGIDTGFIAVSGLPKMRFKQILWRSRSFYPLNGQKDSTFVEGIAIIDTISSDSVFRALVGTDVKMLRFKGESSSMIVQSTEGYYSAVITVLKDRRSYSFVSMVLTDTVRMIDPFVSLSATFRQAVVNRGNNEWGRTMLMGTALMNGEDSLHLPDGDSSITRQYPLQVLFGATLSSYTARLLFDLRNLLAVGKDSLQNIRVYQSLAADSMPWKVPIGRITLLPPNSLIIDSVIQNGLTTFSFYSTKKEAVLGISDGNGMFPSGFILEQNFPNPFNPATTIEYQLQHSAEVELTVFDAVGRKCASLVNERQQAGRYSVLFDASRFSSGMYFSILRSGGKTRIGKMLLIK